MFVNKLLIVRAIKTTRPQALLIHFKCLLAIWDNVKRRRVQKHDFKAQDTVTKPR